MAQPARTPDFEPRPLDERTTTSSFSGVHGPVAAMHQAIRDRFGVEVGSVGVAAAAPDPVEAFIRRTSRVMGWAVLIAGFASAASLLA